MSTTMTVMLSRPPAFSAACTSMSAAICGSAYADPQMAADMLVHAALNAGGRDNITVIVVDMRSDMPCDEDWNVSKIGDDEDIDDALDGTLQTLRVIQ